MKARTNTILKAFMALILMMSMLIAVVPTTPVSAAKMTNKKAQKILKKKIKDKFCKYAFVDLDKDKIDEMLVFGYSGKFVDCDDEETTLTVYKVSGKKATAVLKETLKGDFYQPTLSFNLYYYDKTSYITVHMVHEGYSTHTTYKYKDGKYVYFAYVEEEISEEDTFYWVEDEDCHKEQFDAATKNIFAKELKYDLKLCATKTANKYLKTMLTAYYDRLVEQDAFDEDHVKTSFEDYDDDGLLDMLVVTGKNSGTVLYSDVSVGYPASSAVGAGRLSYTVGEDGGLIFGDGAFQYDQAHGTGLYYTGRWMADNNLYVDITREGDDYVFYFKYFPNAFDSEEWIYFADYLGEDEDFTATFSCMGRGKHITTYTDRATGKITEKVEYEDGAAEFYFPYGEGMTWLDLSDAEKTYYDFKFEKVRDDD